MKLFTRKHYLPWFKRKPANKPKTHEPAEWTVKVNGAALVPGQRWLFVGDDGRIRNGVYTVTSTGGGGK